MARAQFSVALDAATRREVHIEEMFGFIGKKPNFVCVECGQEMVAHCRTVRAPGFAHRLPNTSCIERRSSAESRERQPTEQESPSLSWTPPPLPPEAVPPLARAPVLPRAYRPPPRPTPPVRPWQPLSPTPSAPPPADPMLQDEYFCVGDVYFRGKRCLQLLALYRPEAATPPGSAGGVLTLYTQSADEDRLAQNGREVARWDLGPTRHEALEAFEAELKRLKGRLPDAVEVAAHAPFRRAPKGLRTNASPFPEPLRGPGWTLL